MQDNNLPNNQANHSSYVDDYQPPSSNNSASHPPFGAPAAPDMSDNTDDDSLQKDINDDSSMESSPSPLTDQSLETQNIFDLLGVSDGKEDEKEAFLDELQEVIWEDFIENDVSLLLDEDQVKKLKEIEEKGQTREVQEEMLVYLEELLPDLEDIMMDKALELKEDMVLERISGMKEFYSGNQTALDQISKAEGLISENKWADAGNLLNSIK